MFTPTDGEDGKKEEHADSDKEEVLELAEIHDLAEVERTRLHDGLVAHGRDQFGRDGGLVRVGRVQLRIRDEQGVQTAVASLDGQRDVDGVERLEVAQPLIPERPRHDASAHDEQDDAQIGAQSGFGEEAPVNDESDRKQGDEPDQRAESTADVGVAPLLVPGPAELALDGGLLFFVHLSVLYEVVLAS